MGGLLCQGERMKFAFIIAEKACFPIAFMCRHLGVSTSGLYAWRLRPPSAHCLQDQRLKVLVHEAHQIGRTYYGSPRVHRALKKQAIPLSLIHISEPTRLGM